MITCAPLVAGNLPIKTLVARRWPTNVCVCVRVRVHECVHVSVHVCVVGQVCGGELWIPGGGV